MPELVIEQMTIWDQKKMTANLKDTVYLTMPIPNMMAFTFRLSLAAARLNGWHMVRMDADRKALTLKKEVR